MRNITRIVFSMGMVAVLALATACNAQPAAQLRATIAPDDAQTSKTSAASNGESEAKPASIVVCESTEMLVLENPMLVARGIDPMPSGFDAVNNSTCTFGKAISSVSLELRMDDESAFSQEIAFNPPSTIVNFPLNRADLDPIPASLPVGGYARVITITDVDGDIEQVLSATDSV